MPCLTKQTLTPLGKRGGGATDHLWMATLADLNNLLHAVSTRVAPGFSLDTYFQMVHTTIGRYETPSLHTAIERFSGKPG